MRECQTAGRRVWRPAAGSSARSLLSRDCARLGHGPERQDHHDLETEHEAVHVDGGDAVASTGPVALYSAFVWRALGSYQGATAAETVSPRLLSLLRSERCRLQAEYSACELCRSLSAAEVRNMVEMSDVVSAEDAFAEHEHRKLSAGIDQVHVAAKAARWITPTEMSTSIRRVRDWISTVLIPHAAWEDAVVYPQIDRRTGTDWSTKLMRFEHYQIERVASLLDVDIELLRGTPTHDQATEMRGHLFSLEALLRAHIEREELFLLPLLADNSGPNGPSFHAPRHIRPGHPGCEPLVMSNRRRPPFPGNAAILDGSEAVAYVETRLSEACCAYPITPSTTMAALFQAAVADGKANLWGTRLTFMELESEHSSASAAEGFALAGGRVTNFTAGQGLVLMKEVLHVISGKRLPVVFHVGARALTSQALSIHAGHDDIMAVADAGWGILFARNVQEAADLSAIARFVAEQTETPFFVVQDGFLTTHTLENARMPEDKLLRAFVGDPRARIHDFFDPAEALMTGVVQNQDSYMKGRVAQRAWYEQVPGVLREAMSEWAALTGRQYGLIDAYRTQDAKQVIVAMGTIAESARDVVDHLRAGGRSVGVIGVTSFRPFPAQELAAALETVEAVAVVERTDEPAASANPLTRELKAALADVAADGRRIPRVVSAAAGMGSRDVSAGDIHAVFDWLADESKLRSLPFAVLGVLDRRALDPVDIVLRPRGAYSLRGHSIGGFGSVTINRLLATIMGETFDLHVQAYPRYGSEKRGLPTTYYLTIAQEPIRQHSELRRVDLVALYDVAAFAQGNPLVGLVDGGTLFVHSLLRDAAAIWASLSVSTRTEIVARGIRLVALDTLALAERYAPTPELARRMQGAALVGVFLRVAPVVAARGLTVDQLMAAVRGPLHKHLGKRGGRVVDANLELIRAAYQELIDVTAASEDELQDVTRTVKEAA